MAQLICPSCGSEYFLTYKTGPKTIFKVTAEGAVQVIQSPTNSFRDGDIDQHNICCGACSWQGKLDELKESQRD